MSLSHKAISLIHVIDVYAWLLVICRYVYYDTPDLLILSDGSKYAVHVTAVMSMKMSLKTQKDAFVTSLSNFTSYKIILMLKYCIFNFLQYSISNCVVQKNLQNIFKKLKKSKFYQFFFQKKTIYIYKCLLVDFFFLNANICQESSISTIKKKKKLVHIL